MAHEWDDDTSYSATQDSLQPEVSNSGTVAASGSNRSSGNNTLSKALYGARGGNYMPFDPNSEVGRDKLVSSDEEAWKSGKSTKPNVGQDGYIMTASDWADAKSKTFDKLYGTGGSSPTSRYSSASDLYFSGNFDDIYDFYNQAFQDFGNIAPRAIFDTYSQMYPELFEDGFSSLIGEDGSIDKELLRKIWEAEIQKNDIDEIAQDRSRWREVGGYHGEQLPDWISTLIAAQYPDATEDQFQSKAKEYLADTFGAGGYSNMSSADYNMIAELFNEAGLGNFQPFTPWSNSIKGKDGQVYGYGNYESFTPELAAQYLAGKYEGPESFTKADAEALLDSEFLPQEFHDLGIDPTLWLEHPLTYLDAPGEDTQTTTDEFGNILDERTGHRYTFKEQTDPTRKKILKAFGF